MEYENAKDATVRVWDIAKRREVRRLLGHLGTVGALTFTHDNRSLITVGSDATAIVWDVSDL